MPRKVGRPELGAEARVHTAGLKWSANELAIVTMAANLAGVPRSELVRDAALAHAERVIEEWRRENPGYGKGER
jgi:uncharacterized protein (DUF1778 family)